MAKKVRARKKFRGSVSRNAAKQARGSQFGHLNLPKGISIFKEEPGSRVSLDIMPYEVTIPNHPDRDDEYEIAVPGSLWYKRPYFLHRNIGPENRSIICPSSVGQKCPICEHRAQLMKEGADWNDDSVRALKPSMRNLYVVVPKGSKKFEEKPHVWDISQFLFQEKLNEEVQENEEFETFPDLEEGYTLRIRFSEESFGSNKFAETSRIDFKDRDKPYKESILDDIPHLDDLLEVPSYKTVEAMFFGGLDEDEIEDDEEEETPKRRTASRKNFKDDEDEEEDDEDSDDEEDDDSESDDDDEEEDEEEDDDDDEEEPEPPKPPVRRTSRASKKEERKAPASPSRRGKGKKKEEAKPERKAGKGKGKCPHGHKFGGDCDEFDDCTDCEQWDACMEASEEGS